MDLDGDLDTRERFADGAAGLCFVGEPCVRLGIEPLDATSERQVDAGQSKAAGRVGTQRDICGDLQSARVRPAAPMMADSCMA